MTAKLDTLIDYLAAQDIVVARLPHKPSFIDPDLQISGVRPTWTSVGAFTEQEIDLSAKPSVESMSMASMAAVHQLQAKSGDKVLDVCAAPGMKGLYLNKLVPEIEYYANDLSTPRLARLVKLLKKHMCSISAVTKYDARFIDRAYDHESFDRLLIDAPCSGEGVILGGSDELLKTWSTAKVKRLQQLQISILKSSWKLLKPNGRLIYATCTLNKNENERVIKKALGISVDVQESELSMVELPELSHSQAWRILPSKNSIGFFVAVLVKQPEA